MLPKHPRPATDRPAAAGPLAGGSEREERLLLARVAAGEMAAFEALYRCYHPRLLRFLGRMTRRPALVDELLNDTLFVVWHRASSFNGASKVSTWVLGIAYRKALKALSRLDEPGDDAAATGRDVAAESRAGPDELRGRSELQAALLQALDGLSPEHRAVVDLTYFHGLDYREIAQIADCPVDTVKTRMFHARRRLRALLAGDREDWPS